jgi:hypothetical protein
MEQSFGIKEKGQKNKGEMEFRQISLSSGYSVSPSSISQFSHMFKLNQ